MDNRAIGVFDSGLGGLTAVRALRELLPSENIVYLGDTLRVPYGNKSREELKTCAEQDIAFLLSKDVKLILIACGTVSSTLSEQTLNSYEAEVVGVLSPAVDAAIEKTVNKKIGIMATAASIRAGAYRREIVKKLPDAEVFDIACPRLVPLIESGRLEENDAEVRDALNEYLPPLKKEGIDTLILGCTHYPLLKDAIAAFMGDAELIDVGKQAAERVRDIINKKGIGAKREKGSCSFFVSGDKESFKENGGRFLGFDLVDVQSAKLF